MPTLMDIRPDITAMGPITALVMGIRPIATIVTIHIIMDIALITFMVMAPDITVGEAAITGEEAMVVGEVVITGEEAMVVGEVGVTGEEAMVVAEIMVGEEGADSEISVCKHMIPK